MDRIQLLLIGLPIFLCFSDILNLFSSKPTNHDDPGQRLQQHNHHQHQSQYQPQSQHQTIQEPLPFPTQQNPIVNIGGTGLGSTVNIAFCTSCSYKGNAATVKNALETAFPGIRVTLENYPPTLPKRLLSKVVTVAQVGVVGIVFAGDKVLPRLGITTPPPWYHSLCANKFRTLTSVWMLGNFVQSSLQSSGAFEVSCNGRLVFSKLREHRFPGEIELKDLVGKTLNI